MGNVGVISGKILGGDFDGDFGGDWVGNLGGFRAKILRGISGIWGF